MPQGCLICNAYIMSGVFLNDIGLLAVNWGLALLGILQLVVAFVVMLTVDPVGRKPLLLGGKSTHYVQSLGDDALNLLPVIVWYTASAYTNSLTPAPLSPTSSCLTMTFDSVPHPFA